MKCIDCVKDDREEQATSVFDGFSVCDLHRQERWLDIVEPERKKDDNQEEG